MMNNLSVLKTNDYRGENMLEPYCNCDMLRVHELVLLSCNILLSKNYFFLKGYIFLHFPRKSTSKYNSFKHPFHFFGLKSLPAKVKFYHSEQ